jgi:uncharacterized membrane protein HdeD (DUF308 family)
MTMFRSMSRSLLMVGLSGVAIGIVAIAWPRVTIAFIVAVFAVAAFIGAVNHAMRAFSSATAGPVAGHLMLSLLDLAAGIVAIAWPGITAYALTIWIGAWAIVMGVGEFGMALGAHEAAGDRALYGFGGLLSVALGVVLFARPDVGAVSLATIFGLFSLGYGIWTLVLAARIHRIASKFDSSMHSHA